MTQLWLFDVVTFLNDYDQYLYMYYITMYHPRSSQRRHTLFGGMILVSFPR